MSRPGQLPIVPRTYSKRTHPGSYETPPTKRRRQEEDLIRESSPELGSAVAPTQREPSPELGLSTPALAPRTPARPATSDVYTGLKRAQLMELLRARNLTPQYQNKRNKADFIARLIEFDHENPGSPLARNVRDVVVEKTPETMNYLELKEALKERGLSWRKSGGERKKEDMLRRVLEWDRVHGRRESGGERAERAEDGEGEGEGVEEDEVDDAEEGAKEDAEESANKNPEESADEEAEESSNEVADEQEDEIVDEDLDEGVNEDANEGMDEDMNEEVDEDVNEKMDESVDGDVNRNVGSDAKVEDETWNRIEQEHEDEIEDETEDQDDLRPANKKEQTVAGKCAVLYQSATANYRQFCAYLWQTPKTKSRTTMRTTK